MSNVNMFEGTNTLCTSDSAFMALNISMATSTDKDRVDALALPYVK